MNTSKQSQAMICKLSNVLYYCKLFTIIGPAAVQGPQRLNRHLLPLLNCSTGAAVYLSLSPHGWPMHEEHKYGVKCIDFLWKEVCVVRK